MNLPLLSIFNKFESIGELLETVTTRVNNITAVTPFYGSTKSLFVRELFNQENSIVLLFPTVKEINETRVELNILGLGDKIIAIDNLESDSIQKSITDLNIMNQYILISSYDILKVKLPSLDAVKKKTTLIQIGGEIGYDELVEYMNLLHYQKEKYVENPGDFSIRGSIIDFWSYSEKQACRLEYDGDFLESIRHFDAETQRSSDKVESITLAAAIDPDDEEHTSDIFDYLQDPVVIANDYDLNKSFEKKTEPVEEAAQQFEIDDDLKSELYNEDQEEKTSGEELTAKVIIEDEIKIENLFEKKARWIIEEGLAKTEDRINLNISEAPVINSNFELLFNVLVEYSGKGNQIIITSENELQKKRLYDLLSDFKDELAWLLDEGKIKIEVLPIKSGFYSKPNNFLVLTDYQIFNKPFRTKVTSKRKHKKSRAKEFASIKRGDYVVHEYYGIGRYVGLETIKIGMVEQETIKILYAEGGVVYVNLNYLSLVKKYSSQDNAQPSLSVLGSNEWKSTKKKVKAKIKEAARQLIQLYAKRKASEGFSFSADSIWQKELEASFFYEDTPDQTKITDEVKTDMESGNPMDRLVCGDVGFGKTEIAVRAAFKAVNDGKQVAVMSPTTILTEQHYNTFRDRLSQFPVKVAALSRFQNRSAQTEIVKKMKGGQVDVVIGTHRLLSKDIGFKDLGLLIVDEEHRFGVMAKEKLRQFRTNVDTLTLTATPIPRTLNMSLLGARDLSIMATAPPNRQPIYTKVDKFDIVKIGQWVMKEIHRGGQIYFVHDRVQSIDKIAAYIQKYLPEVKIAIAHGQMKSSQLEKVIYDFLNKKYHMLVSTKIIESGLDIPNVNTIIVNRADRFGLAELHQLRGRVGRSDRQAYAYFLVPSLNTITKKAVRRLQAIEEYTDIGEGFNLSMRDLEIRGAGNLLGTEQSGFIDTVGFEMYMKLLDEAVEELKVSEFKEVFKDLPAHLERSASTIDSYFKIGIPEDYMPEQGDRLGFYTALFSMVKIEEVDEIKEEMEDRFGKMPEIVEQLIKVAKLRFYASFALFERVVIQKDNIAFVLPKEDKEDYYKNKFVKLMQYVVDNYSKIIEFKQGKETMKFQMKNNFESIDDTLEYLTKFCEEVMEVITENSTEKNNLNTDVK
ncbi:transcription-repair coupling factor [Bacteroidota bacterium]